MIVIDTHVAVWYASGIKLRRAATTALESALSGDGAALSAISAWEIGMLIDKGRLVVSDTAAQYVQALFRRDGIVEEPVSAQIALRAATLPSDFYGDPADRIIVATAALAGVPLMTRDERIITYLRKTKLSPVIAC